MAKTDYLSDTIAQNKFNNQIATKIMIVSNEVKIAGAHEPAASLPRPCLQSPRSAQEILPSGGSVHRHNQLSDPVHS